MKPYFLWALTAACCCGLAQRSSAQFSINGQYMARSEMRHGYQTLADTNQKASVFVSQRARLSADFKAPRYRVHMSVQDIRTWGSVANNVIDTKGFLSVYEAYGEVNLTKNLSTKVGRQAISHGDERIFGSLDWNMQGRRHDALVIKYKDSTLMLESGFAYNQDMESNRFILYTVNNYKHFEYLWYNHQLDKLNLGALFLNTGFTSSEYNTGTKKIDTFTNNVQTLGVRAEYKDKNFSVSGYAYYQRGWDLSDHALSAFDVSLEGSLTPVKGLIFTAGTEYLSGTSQVDTANKINHSFNPYFGTNHRFNGYMDYFYVGNHLNTVGLHDVFLKTHYSQGRFLGGISVHMFNAAADIRNKAGSATDALNSRYLGTELDFTLGYNIADGVALQGGYSRYLGSSGMQMLRGTSSLTPTSHWAYLMLIVRPNTVKWPRSGLKL